MKQTWYDPKRDEIVLIEMYEEHCLRYIGDTSLDSVENVWRCFIYPPEKAGLILIGEF